MMAHPLSSPLDAAEMFTARGWVVFPCDHPDAGTHCTGTARACRERRCKAEADPAQRGKHPRVAWGSITEPVDAAQRAAWWGRAGLLANIAIACGPSGLLIVDEDTDGALTAYAASIGATVPDTFRVRTSRGWHWYFTVPTGPDGERLPIGNSPGALAAWHCDVRGGASASGERGGYVITAGSTHASGRIYTAPDPYAPAVVAPEWLIEAIMSPGPSAPAEGLAGTDGDPGGARLRASDGARWDDATRYGSAGDLLGQFERHCDEVQHTGGEFRFELFRAARDGWRLVHLGLLPEDDMLRTLEACVWRIWQAEPDDRDHTIVFSEALPAAQRSPWELTGTELRARAGVTTVEPGRAFLRSSEAAALAAADHEVDHPTGRGVTSENEADDLTVDGNRPVERDHAPSRPEEIDIPPAPPGVDPAGWRTEYRQQAVREAVREYRAAQGRPALLVLSPSQRKGRPRPNYLVPKMLYRNGLAVVFGAPGSGKSFLALDIALSFAAGRIWRGTRLATESGAPGMVHYVMAEAEDSNNLRIDAWLYHHSVDEDDIEDRFRSIPAAIMLTEAGIKAYLPYVERDKPDLIVLDTKNLMFAGRESAGEDYGEMLRALHMLQVAAGGCAIILIDHSGLGDPSRPRGNNAEEGGMDTMIMVTDDHGLRTAKVTKDRSAELGTAWHYRLHQIPEVPRPAFVDPPAVVVEADPDMGPLRPRTPWPDRHLSDDATKAIQAAKGKGREAAADVLRLLSAIELDEEGQTKAAILRMIAKEGPREYAETTIKNAINLLVGAAMITNIGTTALSKFVVEDQWRAHVTEP